MNGMDIAIVALVVLHLGDLLLSIHMLNKSWMEEANPLAAWIYQRCGSRGLVAWKIVLLGIFLSCVWLIQATHVFYAGLLLGVGIGSGLVTVYQLWKLLEFNIKWRSGK